MSSPTSSDASLYPSPVRRTVYVLTDVRGWFLADLEPDQEPVFTPDPIQALRNGMAWLTREVGEERHRLMAAVCPLALAAVVLELRPDGWAAISSVANPLV